MNNLNVGQVGLTSLYRFEAFRKPVNMDAADWLALSGQEKVEQGTPLWDHENHNTVVNVGLNDALDKYFKGSTYTAAFYVGITGTTPTVAAADTMATHAGWTEVTAYSEAVRQTLTLGTVASQSVDNTASKAVFTINADTTVIGGGFVTTDSTKGGTTGTLYGGAAFSAGDKSLDTSDVLQVSVTLTAASV